MSSTLITLPCGCTVEIMHGGNLNKFHKGCATHSKLDVIDQLRLIQEGEAIYAKRTGNDTESK